MKYNYKWGIFLLVIGLFAILALAHRYKIEKFTNVPFQKCMEAGELAELLNEINLELQEVEGSIPSATDECFNAMFDAGVSPSSSAQEINSIPECKEKNNLTQRRQILVDRQKTTFAQFIEARDFCRTERKEKPAQFAVRNLNACSEAAKYVKDVANAKADLDDAPPGPEKMEMNRRLTDINQIYLPLKNQCTQLTNDINEMIAYRKKQIADIENARLEAERKAREEKEAAERKTREEKEAAERKTREDAEAAERAKKENERLAREQKEAEARAAQEAAKQEKERALFEDLGRNKALVESARQMQSLLETQLRDASNRAEVERQSRERSERECAAREAAARGM
jgi:hypothetical protein